ncbi:MAG: helix-turn-helix domain-containing protein [Betaproteobacteria bacterium]|nr:helix-turn-helix domain-containing protein [Betaproteobacteria bacterium]
MKSPGSSVNPREIRRKLGLNQKEFWTRIGVTQSGGSRYESGRKMPTPVREMLRLIHVERLDLSKVKKVDFDIIDLLKSEDPKLYRRLRKALRVKPRKAGERGGARGKRAVRSLPRTGRRLTESWE